MPSVKKMLQPYDLDLISRICSFWGVDSSNMDISAAVQSLHEAMQDENLIREVIESMPIAGREAWEFLAVNPQKVTWAQFIRKYGEIREYGPAKRERENPELHPVSTAEILWYRGLIGRAFMNLPPEPREFVFIPDDLLKYAKNIQKNKPELNVEILSGTGINEMHANSRLIDHMIDWLAAKRMGRELPEKVWKNWGLISNFVSKLAFEDGLVDRKGIPVTESLPVFFQLDRNAILRKWLAIWIKSTEINDLKLLPGLLFEGEWQNDPCRPRQFLLDILQNLEKDKWYSLNSFLLYIKNTQPDFQRPSGDYDSWFIRNLKTNEYLRGFEHWEDVDGRLIRFLLCGPLHWLGVIDLGLGNKKTEVLAFRITSRLQAIFKDEPQPLLDRQDIPVKIFSDLQFSIPLFASRTLRYQLGRFCEVSSITSQESNFTFTPDSLKRAQENGLKISQLIQLLEKQQKSPLPSSLVFLAEKWEITGIAAKVEPSTLLRTYTKEIMQNLLENPQTKRYIIELVSPVIALINPLGVKVIKKTLLEQGLLTEVKLEV